MGIDPVWSDTMSMRRGTVSESVFISVSFGSNEAHSQAARSQKWWGGRIVNVVFFTPHQIQLRPIKAIMTPKGAIYLFFSPHTVPRAL